MYGYINTSSDATAISSVRQFGDLASSLIAVAALLGLLGMLGLIA